MPFSGNDLLWGLAVPLLVAAGLRGALVWISGHFVRSETNDTAAIDASYASEPHVSSLETSLPLVAGAAVGYFTLTLGPWYPEAHYEWLPIGIAIAMLAAIAVNSAGQSKIVRFGVLPFVYLVVAAGVGYLLMPTWEDLSPSYIPYLFGCSIGVTVVSIATELSPASRGWPFAVVWLGTCLAVSAVVAISESLRFAQIAGLTLGASVGLVAVGLLFRRSLLGGVGLTLTTYLAGILLIAHVNSWSGVPLVCYWLPMAGPLLSAVAGALLPKNLGTTLGAILVILSAAIPSTVAVVIGILATLSE